LLFFGILYVVQGEDTPGVFSPEPPAGQSDQTIQYKINSYTMPEENKNAKPIPVRPIPADYKPAARSGALELYVSDGLTGIMLKDKRSGYVWSSVPDESVLKQERMNEEVAMSFRSPFLIEYYDENSMMRRAGYGSFGDAVSEVETLDNGVKATYTFAQAGISFAMEVKLEDGDLIVRIPDDEIKEEGAFKLASIQPFPYLGAVRKSDIPGYIFIPDGSGALIRFQAQHPRYDQSYDGRIYDWDYAVENPENRMGYNEQSISMPVFGMVHGVKQNAFLGIVEDGKYNARIIANPSGVTTNFYWVAPKLIWRYPYFQPTSKNMGGYNTYQKERIRESLQVRYRILSGADADYVGMAKAYRSYLAEQGVLERLNEVKEHIPIRIEMLGADKEKGIIGSRIVKMTSFEEADAIAGELQASGVHNLGIVFRGWNRGGLHGSNPDKFPVEKDLGGESGLRRLKQSLEEKGVSLTLYSDYATAYGKARGFNAKADGIRTIGNQVLSYKMYTALDEENDDGMTVYFMNPRFAADAAKKDAERFAEMGIDRAALANIGQFLLSDHHPKRKLSRKDAADEYAKLAEALLEKGSRLSFYSPFDYLWKYSDEILSVPMYSSQYMFATDTVPFMQIVLHGYIDYFAPNANYDANPREYLLRMIEYGAYPSFDVTHEPSWKLKHSYSNYMYTSHFDDWKEEIAAVYGKMDEALKTVQNAAIEERNVLDYGVVEVVYSNGVRIVVNYRSDDVTYGHTTISGNDFAVVGGE
jgi:hypothetical protein